MVLFGRGEVIASRRPGPARLCPSGAWRIEV